MENADNFIVLGYAVSMTHRIVDNPVNAKVWPILAALVVANVNATTFV